MLVPGRLFLTRGAGRHRNKLISWEMALHEARISPYNLVRVSSIFPPNCKVVSRDEGLEAIVPGQVVYAVISSIATRENGRMIAASIGLAKPGDPNRHGYLSEYHSIGETAAMAGSRAESLASEMLSASLGQPAGEDGATDETGRLRERFGGLPDATSIARSAIGDREGRWTTAVAVAVLLP
jgi:arginine decarboxylase